MRIHQVEGHAASGRLEKQAWQAVELQRGVEGGGVGQRPTHMAHVRMKSGSLSWLFGGKNGH